MPYETAIHLLDKGAVMAECGPMRLVISSFIGKNAQREMNVKAAKVSFGIFERTARFQDLLRAVHESVPRDLEEPVAAKMISSVISMGEPDLTPMAAVAGTIADSVADFLFDAGMTRVIVNNGGDIAIRLKEGASVAVGIRDDLRKESFSHVLSLDSIEPSWGIATSGLGGRSLTRGIASAACIIARDASVADAAATVVGNAACVEDESLIRRDAVEMDPYTDLGRMKVTESIGELSEEKKQEAIRRGMKRARELMERKMIFGAFLSVQGRVEMTGFFRERMNC
ncbi:MAG TPA: hypothetical protein HPP59_07215 [Deltaproteobacteria bacterium]|nr:hypothetical protein [Deltaproteobacteria bacterium]